MFRWLQQKLTRRPNANHENVWPSVVMLLKEPIFPSAEESVQIANACWGQAIPVELASTESDGNSYLLRRGSKPFSVNRGHGTYDVDGREPTEILQRPWDEHHAWLSIDMPLVAEGLHKSDAWGESLKLLLIFAFKYWSPNCLAVYFPTEGLTVPNFGELAESIRWGRQNGLKLDFLNESK